MRDYSEDALIEQPAIALFGGLGWQTINCFDERMGPDGTLGRETRAEVVLAGRLRPALARLNPGLPAEALDRAVDELRRDRSTLQPVHANREVWRLLTEGVRVTLRDPATGAERTETVRVVDWDAPAHNDFLLASQLWVRGDLYTRRPDLVGFVNGLPLVLVELKAVHQRLKNAYDGNLRDYKDTIPQLFWYNALILLSNGTASRLGSLTAGWEHFFEWKKINDEGEQGAVSLETLIRGVCDPTRLLDLVRNFTLFNDAAGGLAKIVAKNHQYLGVNRAVAAVRAIHANHGKLGVFWHTQGSGKSLSMVFFSQKVHRTIPGNWTFVVVTDRDELDGQIYKTFAQAGAVSEPEQAIRAESGAHLQDLLRGNHRIVFTLIQKFHSERGRRYPALSRRNDIIVITDEAHRSQYADLARNMRDALPQAAFLAFTGTPLIRDERQRTREVFGDYMSVYNFQQSVQDGTTVPLYYENRVPELQLTNADFNEDMQQLLEAAALDPDQEKLLERQFAREYHLITRNDRLERIAQDIVTHFMGRGQPGKAMVVAIDKATAVRLYDKVQAYWRRALEDLRARTRMTQGDQHERLAAKLAYLEATDMAVVVSQAQNEVADFAAKGLDIASHRRRMNTEDLETRFKNPDDPLRIVFVCAMWMVGFDVPSLTTLYLDKPVRNHTLMQTIARANRVFGDKMNGLIVDYVGIFRHLQRALVTYGAPHADGAADPPIRDKVELTAQLAAALAEAEAFCAAHGVNTQSIQAAAELARVALLGDAVDALLANDDTKRHFFELVARVARLYRAILPDTAASAYSPRVAVLVVLAAQIKAEVPQADISGVLDDIEHLLDESIAAEGYVIRPALGRTGEGPGGYTVEPGINLSKFDFEALRAAFARAHKHTEAEKLRGAITSKLTALVRLNKSRIDYLARLRQLIDEYNTGKLDVDQFFDRLIVLARQVSAEEGRAAQEGLSEEELALFDVLTPATITLSPAEREQVKQVVRTLLTTLKRDDLVLDWRARQQSRAQVLITVQRELDDGLPPAYTPALYNDLCDAVFQHIQDAYQGLGQSAYTQAS